MSEIPPEVRKEVGSELDRIEAENEVRVPEWYLSVDVNRRRDVIERRHATYAAVVPMPTLAPPALARC